jgi:hypothetical protein
MISLAVRSNVSMEMNTILAAGSAYDSFMGRWSRVVAGEFLALRGSRLLFSNRFPAFLFLKQLLGSGVNSSAEFFASGKVLFSFFNPSLHQ